MLSFSLFLFFFNDTATTEIYTLSLHDALPIFKTGDEYGKDAVVAFEDLIGRKIGVRRVYHLWNDVFPDSEDEWVRDRGTDRKSTRLNSSHGYISYAVFCLKKKKKQSTNT